jgi:hypothetical protein
MTVHFLLRNTYDQVVLAGDRVDTGSIDISNGRRSMGGALRGRRESRRDARGRFALRDSVRLLDFLGSVMFERMLCDDGWKISCV